jgi:subtilisin family serine protease
MMKYLRVLLLALTVLLAVPQRTLAAPSQQINWDDPDVVPGQLIVTYRSEAAQGPTAGNAARALGLLLTPIDEPVRQAVTHQLGSTAAFRSLLPNTFVGTFNRRDRDQIIAALVADPSVVYVEPVRRRATSTDWGTATPTEYDTDAERTALWGMRRIGAPNAWASGSATRSAIRAAVMEGSYDTMHRDLVAQRSAAQNNAAAITNHATHVAGTIAATGNNNQDVVGVANVELVSLGDGDTNTSFAQYITWAANNQVRVINMSWKYCGDDGMDNGDDCDKCLYPTASATEQNAITNASNTITFVGSAGNDNCSTDAGGRAPIPVSYTNVIGVSAIDNGDNRAGFSNTGTYVDLAAPGVGILSTIQGNMTGTMSGTSMAAPHVSGSVAAVLAARPNYDVESIPWLLRYTAEDLGSSGWDTTFGHGVVRVDRAVAGIADRYVDAGANCGSSQGTLVRPDCSLVNTMNTAPNGWSIGILRGNTYPGARTLSKPMTLKAIGGPVIFGQ